MAEDVAAILKLLAVMLEIEQVTVGAVRSMASRSMVVDAVIEVMEVPEYVPENRQYADRATPVLVPLEL